jgi:predicted membrane chloride channel (bestrophin family)
VRVRPGYWATQNSDSVRDIVLNPTAYFSAISLVLGFLLVFRTQLSYGRYWEGRTALQVCAL